VCSGRLQRFKSALLTRRLWHWFFRPEIFSGDLSLLREGSCGLAAQAARLARSKSSFTIMDQQQTRFDKLLARIKNNPVIASLLVVGTIVIAASTFTDSAQKILGLFVKEETPDIAGKWRTQALTNPYDESEQYVLLFDFLQRGDALSGTVTEMDVDGTNAFARSIMEGKIKGNLISFYTTGEVTSDEGTRPYKEAYSGILNKKRNEIAFKRLDDLPDGGIVETFVAARY
jgi:hypothetical protein